MSCAGAAPGPTRLAAAYRVGSTRRPTRRAHTCSASGTASRTRSRRNGRPFFATHDTRRSDVVFRRGEAIAHPAKVTYERLLVVAPRGDTAAVASELFFLSGGTPGGVEAVITWDAVPAARRAESRVSLRRVIEPGAAPPAFPDPPSLWLTAPSDGAITAELPPGRYAAKLEGPGVSSAESVAVVEAGKVTNLALVASIFDGASQIPQKE